MLYIVLCYMRQQVIHRMGNWIRNRRPYYFSPIPLVWTYFMIHVILYVIGCFSFPEFCLPPSLDPYVWSVMWLLTFMQYCILRICNCMHRNKALFDNLTYQIKSAKKKKKKCSHTFYPLPLSRGESYFWRQ